MSDEIKANKHIVAEVADALQQDYSPGYDIHITHEKVNEGARIVSSIPTKLRDVPINSPTHVPNFEGAENDDLRDSYRLAYNQLANTNQYNHLNIDIYDVEEVVNFYNKYKTAWELEKGAGTPFVYSVETAQELLQIIKVWTALQGISADGSVETPVQLEATNVYYDHDIQEWVVIPNSTEQARYQLAEYTSEYFNTERLPTLSTITDKLYRNENGWLLRNPADQNSFYAEFDVTDQNETMEIYQKYQGLWFAETHQTVFTYTLENAQKLKDVINRRILPYIPNIPDSWRTLRERVRYSYDPTTGVVPHLLAQEGQIVTTRMLDMSEYQVTKQGPDSTLAEDGENLTGWYDWGSPYASGKNRF